MNVRMRKLSFYDIWFLIPFCVWLFVNILSTSFFNVYIIDYYFPHIMFGCAFVLFVRELFLLNHTNEKEIVGSLLIIFMMYCMFQFQRDTMMITLFVVYCMRNTKFNKVASAALLILIIGFGFIIFSSQAGIIQDYIEITTSRTRHYLGFRYSLFGPAMYFNMVALVIYLRKNNIHLGSILILFVIDFLLYCYTNSRLSFILTALLLFCSIIAKLQYKQVVDNKWIYRMAGASLVVCLVFSFVLIMKYDVNNVLLVKLNGVLGNRLQLGRDAIYTYGFNWLGNPISYVGNGLDSFGNKSTAIYNYVDNFYIHYFQMYGILFMGIVLSLVIMIQAKCKKWKNIYLTMILSIFAIHGIVDDLMFTLHYNMFFVTCTYLMNGESRNSILLKICKVCLLFVMGYYMAIRYSIVI